MSPEPKSTSSGPGWSGRGTKIVARLPRGARALSWAGILLGLLAAWVALPPLTVRSLVLPIVIAAAAVALGAVSIVRRDVRFGIFAVVSGVFGVGMAILAGLSSVDKLESVVVWSALFAAMLRFATPLMFASLGGLFSERSGVVNIGLEGMMLTGAFFAILGADKTDSWVLGLLIGVAAGAVLASVHALFAISLRADQIVGGTAVNFLALGVTGYLFIDIYGTEGTPTDTPSIPNVHLAFLEDVPFLGGIFGNLNLMIWLALATVVITWVVMFRTPVGLRIRSVGEHPRAADTVGINVYLVRYAAVILSGALAAAGGAYLSIGFVNSFNENMTAGRGFIALAALIFGNWRPFTAAAACMLFGFSSALAQRLPEYSQSASVLFQALPYVLTLIAVAGVIGRSIPPAAVGRPYKKQ
jgi:simple sugar transport system permease protein